MRKLLASGTIFEAPFHEAKARIAFFPSLFHTSNKKVCCVFQMGPYKNAPSSELGLCISHDQGASWEQLPLEVPLHWGGIQGSPAIGTLAEREDGALLVFVTWYDRTDPDRPLFDPVTEGILHSKLLCGVSTDGGHTWKEWKEMATGDLGGCALTGPALSLSRGTIGIPFESFKLFDEHEDRHPGAWMLVSRDGGHEFSEVISVATDASGRLCFWDQRLCGIPQQEGYLGLFWTHDRVKKEDLNVHVLQKALDGAPQKNPESTSIPGQIAAPLLLDDGRLVAFVVDRQGKEATMRIWVSEDLGATWPPEYVMDVYNHLETASLTQGSKDIDFAQYWEDMGMWSFGHPTLLSLDGGVLLTAYYSGTPEHLGIRWAKVSIS